MKFSICIPNYNYERYLGETIRSALDQQGVDLEILLSDNASTDTSLAIAQAFNDPRIQCRVNAVNVGFAGNLDRAARMAGGDYLIMLSSDDLIRPGTLATYQALLSQASPNQPTVISSSWDVISSTGEVIGREGPDPDLWTEADRVPALDKVAGGPVYRVAGDELLRRCLKRMRNPFNFAATCYARTLYDRVEGYGGSRMMNPDKAFSWKLLGVTEAAYWVDARLFAYRVHNTNQLSQESAAGALKFMVDEYVSTLEIDSAVLSRVGVSRESVFESFVENDVGRHGLATLAKGQRAKARRILDFGRAAYPAQVRRNRYARALRALLALGPVGQKIASRLYRSYQSRSGQKLP